MGIDIKDLTTEALSVITKEVLKQDAKHKKITKKREHDRRLRNTNLLLSNYRKLKLHIKTNSPIDATLSYEVGNGEIIQLDSIAKYHEKSRMMLRYLDAILAGYKVQCESGGEAEYRRYQVLNKYYLSTPHLSIPEIALFYNCDKATISRAKANAINDISVLLYGFDALQDIVER
ncbi:hypothetical protein [Latilactobacillus sakei]|uniref:hypothetical protein n=1 Tax=Latilactobacillus sakei TaxID=1599 RepID=UPI0020C748A3|nr:hypothetical protein [Latilactobacillus sakei]MCP8851767.1 hypothetical protein [Latilactobacillus sakei]